MRRFRRTRKPVWHHELRSALGSLWYAEEAVAGIERHAKPSLARALERSSDGGFHPDWYRQTALRHFADVALDIQQAARLGATPAQIEEWFRVRGVTLRAPVEAIVADGDALCRPYRKPAETDPPAR